MESEIREKGWKWKKKSPKLVIKIPLAPLSRGNPIPEFPNY